MSISETLKALSDPVRRRILDILKSRAMNAGEISAHFELSDATISHHLSVLKKAGLIESERSGTFISYQINTSLLEDVMNWMMRFKEDEKQ